MAKAFSVPASRRGLPNRIVSPGAGVPPVYHPSFNPSIPRAGSFLTSSQRQIVLGATVPQVATLPQNAGKTLKPVNPTSAIRGVRDVRPIFLGRKGGVGPGATEPGQYVTKSLVQVRKSRGVQL